MAVYRTLLELRTAVRDRVDEATASFWSDAQLNRYINRSKDRVLNRLRGLKDDAYLTIAMASTEGTLNFEGELYSPSVQLRLAVGTTDYLLPPDFLELVSLAAITSGYEFTRFEYRHLNDPLFRDAWALLENQTPSGLFYITVTGSRTLRIVPKSDTGMDLRIVYIQRSADLASDGTEMTSIPYPLYLAVEEYATALALKQDHNPDAAAFEAAGNQIMTEFIGSDGRQIQDVMTAGGYLDPYFGLG